MHYIGLLSTSPLAQRGTKLHLSQRVQEHDTAHPPSTTVLHFLKHPTKIDRVILKEASLSPFSYTIYGYST